MCNCPKKCGGVGQPLEDSEDLMSITYPAGLMVELVLSQRAGPGLGNRKLSVSRLTQYPAIRQCAQQGYSSSVLRLSNECASKVAALVLGISLRC